MLEERCACGARTCRAFHKHGPMRRLRKRAQKIYTRTFGSAHPSTVTLREEISKVRGYIANVRDCATCKDPSCEWGAVARRSF